VKISQQRLTNSLADPQGQARPHDDWRLAVDAPQSHSPCFYLEDDGCRVEWVLLLYYQENVNASVGPELLEVMERGSGSTGAVQNVKYGGEKNEGRCTPLYTVRTGLQLDFSSRPSSSRLHRMHMGDLDSVLCLSHILIWPYDHVGSFVSYKD